MDGIKEDYANRKNIPPLLISSRTLLPIAAWGYSACKMHSNMRVCCLETAKCTAYISAAQSLSPHTPLHLPSDHTAHETNPPPSAVFWIWQRHMVGDNWYRAVLPQWHEMKTGTVHTCALLCNVKRLTME
jgi:hypothetical protein